MMNICDQQVSLLGQGTTIDNMGERFQQATEEVKTKIRDLEKEYWKIVGLGVCPLWGIQQSPHSIKKVSGYAKKVSMVKGPGDVKKGTFKKD